MTTPARPPSRGFTLIELMVVVTIIGLLSSVAMPVYRRATLRARAAERATILQSMNVSVQDAFVRGQVDPALGLSGAKNPAGVEGPGKRSFNNGAAGWNVLNLVIQGDCYYSYAFSAAENGVNTLAKFTTSATGDLDGDGALSAKLYMFERSDGRWSPTLEDPPAGQEDDLSPTATF